jgi:hypothetical protein
MQTIDAIVESMIDIHKMGMAIGMARTAVKIAGANSGNNVAFLELKRLGKQHDQLEKTLDMLIQTTYDELSKLGPEAMKLVSDKVSNRLQYILDEMDAL